MARQTMKLRRSFAGKWVRLLLVFLAAPSLPALYAQPSAGIVTVRGLMGSASYAAAMPLRPGMTIPTGAVIKTGPNGAVDLAFSHNAGVIRLLQNSTLSLDKFTVANSTPGTPVEIQLNLSQGAMAGFDKKLSGSSKYQIKVIHGIADVAGSKYRIDAQGFFVLLEGIAFFAFVPPSGEPLPFQLRAPAPVYFSPLEGVRSAPAELVREVNLQMKGKLRGR